jgi:hypothetical protein
MSKILSIGMGVAAVMVISCLLYFYDSYLLRRRAARPAGQFTRPTQFGARVLLPCSLVALSLAVLGWCGLLYPSLRWITPYALVVILFLAPAFTSLALLDIRKDGWSWGRSLAFVCSGIAVALLVAAIYHIIHRAHAA